MSLKQRVEENAVVWLLGTLAVGFAAGFGAYETILRVSDQTTISQTTKNELERAAARVQELKTELDRMKAREGAAPRHGTLTLTSGVSGSTPVNTLKVAKLGSTVSFYVRWVGLTPGGFYDQRWQLRDSSGGIVYEANFPFVAQDSMQGVWHDVNLDPKFYSAGGYRLRVMLNGQEILDSGITIVASDAGEPGAAPDAGQRR